MGAVSLLRCEWTRLSRWALHYALRAAVGLTLLYVAWVLYDFGLEPATPGGERVVVNPRLAVGIVRYVFLEAAWAIGVVVVLLVPGLAAGSLAEDDRRGTMLDLLASPLSAPTILLGKLTATLGSVAIILAAGLPLVVPLGLLGVLDPRFVVVVLPMLAMLAVTIGSLSLLIAVVVRPPRKPITTAYLVAGAWLLLPPWLATNLRGLPPALDGLRTLNDGLLASNPLPAFQGLWDAARSSISHPTALSGALAPVWASFLRLMTIQATASVVFLTSAAMLLRPVRLGLRTRGRTPKQRRVRQRPPIGDDPMLWKERASRRGPHLAMIAVLCLVVFWPLVEPTRAAFIEPWPTVPGGTSRIWAHYDLNIRLRQLHTGLFVLGLAAIAATSAMSITGERERKTWTSLATTLLTGREVVRAKVFGVLWGMRPLAIPFLIIWGIGLTTGSIHPAGVLAAGAGLLVYGWYASALGILGSMLSEQSSRSIILTFLGLFAGNALPFLFLPPELIGPLGGSGAAIFMAGVTPFVEWIALFSPFDLQAALDGRKWGGQLGLPFGLHAISVRLDPGLLRTYLASLALHAIGALALSRIAAWAFDVARDRPFRFPSISLRPRLARPKHEPLT